MMKSLTLITGNVHKVREIQSILGAELNCAITVSHKKVDLPEYQGDLEFIVREKCLAAARSISGPVLVEDSSLNLSALNGLPGPYIKWFLDAIGANGLVRMIKDWPDKRATGICMMALAADGPNGPVHIFSGKVDGVLVEPRGNMDFGWDPCFQPDGHQKTFGEMDAAMKNKISHRFQCIMKLVEFLLLQEKEKNRLIKFNE